MEIALLVLEFLRRSLPRCISAAGPYLLVEILLPGGSLIALALWLYRHRKTFFEALSIRRLADRP